MSAFSRFPNFVALGLVVATGIIEVRSARSQAPPLLGEQPSGAELLDAAGKNGPNSDGGASEPVLSALELAQAEEWIDQLGSTEFAARERAAGHLMEMGKGVLEPLRRVAKESTDAETRLRAEQIIKQLTDGDLQSRISDFLAGQDVDFAGWNWAQSMLGDSVPVRELFVEMTLAHPEVMQSLEGTARDRALALESLLTRVSDKFRTVSGNLGRADVFALLLIGNDPNVALNNVYESLVLNLMRRQVATQIRRDAHLSGPFHALLNRWIVRSSLASREEVLLLGMAWDLPDTLQLALHTLKESTQTETIGTCMQAIAKFGDRRHSETLTRYLDDARPVSDRGFGNDPSQAQVRDYAILTLAMIHGLPLGEIDMSHIQTHPASGFIPPDLAYSSNNPEGSRERARQRIDRLLREPNQRQ